MEILTDILKVSSPAVAIAVILFLTIKEFLKSYGAREKEVMNLITNHMNHNTSVLKEVIERTKQDTEATKETREVLQGLKETLLKINGFKKL